MNKDILGKGELEFLKLNWKFCGPGLMNGHCAATGTCENHTIIPPGTMERKEKHKIHSSSDCSDATKIRLQYGPLR